MPDSSLRLVYSQNTPSTKSWKPRARSGNSPTKQRRGARGSRNSPPTPSTTTLGSKIPWLEQHHPHIAAQFERMIDNWIARDAGEDGNAAPIEQPQPGWRSHTPKR